MLVLWFLLTLLLWKGFSWMVGNCLVNQNINMKYQYQYQYQYQYINISISISIYQPKYQYEIYLLRNVNPGTVSKRHKLINSLDSILRVLVKSWQIIQPVLRLDLVREVVVIRTWGNVYFTLFFTECKFTDPSDLPWHGRLTAGKGRRRK